MLTKRYHKSGREQMRITEKDGRGGRGGGLGRFETFKPSKKTEHHDALNFELTAYEWMTSTGHTAASLTPTCVKMK